MSLCDEVLFMNIVPPTQRHTSSLATAEGEDRTSPGDEEVQPAKGTAEEDGDDGMANEGCPNDA